MPKLGDMLGGIYDDGEEERRRAAGAAPQPAEPEYERWSGDGGAPAADEPSWAQETWADQPADADANEQRLDEIFAGWNRQEQAAQADDADTHEAAPEYVIDELDPEPEPYTIDEPEPAAPAAEFNPEDDFVLPAAPPEGMGRNTLRMALSEAIQAAGSAPAAPPVITPQTGGGLGEALNARAPDEPAGPGPAAEPEWASPTAAEPETVAFGEATATADPEPAYAQPWEDPEPEPAPRPRPQPAAAAVTVPVFDAPPPPPPSSRQAWVRGADDVLPSRRGGGAAAPKPDKGKDDDKDKKKGGLFRRK